MQPEWASERRGKPSQHLPPLDTFGPQIDAAKLAAAWSSFLSRAALGAGLMLLAAAAFFFSQAREHKETMLLKKVVPENDPFQGSVVLRLLERKSLEKIDKWFLTRKPKPGFVFFAVKVEIANLGGEPFRLNPYTLHLFSERTRYFPHLDWRSLDDPLANRLLAPGGKMQGWTVYELPKGENPLELHLSGVVGSIHQLPL
jgi:hypothetical protein